MNSEIMHLTPLQRGILTLQEDFENGARILATKAVEVLKDAVVDEGKIAQTSEELWNASRLAGLKLKNARPSMGAAIGSALTQALIAIKETWEKELGSKWMEVEDAEAVKRMAEIGANQVQVIITQRNKSADRLADAFTTWLRKKSCSLAESRPIRILTLSYSSSLKACIIKALTETPRLFLDIRIIESRPRFEGANFGIALCKEFYGERAPNDRLSIQIATDSGVAMLAKTVDVVLLGADRISSSGDVSNKMGSLAVTLCAKALSPAVEIVVVSESDKIATPGTMDEHAEEDNDPHEITDTWDLLGLKRNDESLKHCTIRNVYFEWVPSKWIDAYICEQGILTREDVMNISRKTEEIQRGVFGSL